MSEQVVRIVHQRVFNCYLVREADGLTLVDTGPSGALAKIRAEVDRLGAPLRRVLLTHAHADHLGGLDDLTRSDGDLEVIVGQREAALMAGDFSLLEGEPEPGPKQESFGRPASLPARVVNDGEHVGSLRVIATPGHTPGHLSVIDTRDRTLIAGDALTTIGRVAVSGDLVARWPFPAWSTWNKALALESAQRLHDEQPEHLATGHGPVVADATRAIARALKRART
jgi:glyoxylase-like metal-dependent hydrolase (beta-lactamase superfamily II)